MKKFLLFAAGLLMTFAACQKTELNGPAESGLQSITVNVPHGLATKASGDGVQINRCILGIYRNGVLYGEPKAVAVTGGKATFSELRLVSNQTYDFVFWADKAAGSEADGFTDLYYATDDLASIKVKNAYVANDEGFDAFTYCEKDYKVTAAFNLAVTLKRPFGQLNVITKDLDDIKDDTLKPTDVKVAFKSVPTSFNALTGEVADYQAIEYEAAVADAANGLLTVDYILAVPGEASLIDFSMAFFNNGAEICTNDSFTNIPIRRNYKTNVSGNLLTKKGEFNVTIDPEFETPDYDEEIGETATVQTVDDIAEAIESGAREIIVETAPAENAVINIPHTLTPEQASEKVTITIPATDKDITIGYTEDKTGEATKNVELFISTTGTLRIDLPESTVTIRGNVGSLDVSTANDTMIVAEGATVAKLTVNKGNVEIYGQVGEIVFNEGAGIVSVYGVGDAETLKKAADLVAGSKCAKIVLTADIDLKGSADNPWAPMNTERTKFTEFDGQGHVISNLHVNNYDGKTVGGAKGHYYGGLFYVLHGDVRNLTIETADVTCHRGGVLVGRMDFGTVENCHVKNATVKSIQKVGGLVGFVNYSSKSVTIKDSSVDGLSVSTLLTNDGLWQAGGLLGFLQTSDRNVLIQGNSVRGISFGKVSDGAPDAPYYDNDFVYVLEQNYSHAFIGTVSNVSTKDFYSEYSIVLKDNKVEQQLAGIPTCDRTDDFIGWWAGDYNAAGYPYSVKVIVDGVEKNRWIEVERLVNRLKKGGDIIVWRDYDFTKWPGTTLDVESPIELTNPTKITIKKGAKWTVGKQQLVNKSELTVRGEGEMSATAYVFMNEGGATLTVESGTYRATEATDANGVVIYNQGVLNIKGGTFDGPGFTVMNTGSANATIDGGNIMNSGIVTSYALVAYGRGVRISVNGGKVDALQSNGGAEVTINGGSVVNDTKDYYAIYNEGGNTVVNGGYISGAPGYNDVYIAGGKVEIKGGFFEDNKTPAANGFIYKEKVQTVEGVSYNWEVVPAN